MTERVLITPEAEKIVNQLREEHGELMFHQSGGCCDGSQPMCFPKGEFRVSDSDVLLGEIGAAGYISISTNRIKPQASRKASLIC